MGTILRHLMNDRGASLAEAKNTLAKWELRKIRFGERDVGEIMLQENEIHFALEPTYRRVMGRGKLLSRFLDELIEEKQFLVTRLFKNDPVAPLVKFMGFRLTHQDNECEYYWMDKETRNDRRQDRTH